MIGTVGKSSRLQAQSGVSEVGVTVEPRMRGAQIAAIVKLQSGFGRVPSIAMPPPGGRRRAAR